MHEQAPQQPRLAEAHRPLRAVTAVQSWHIWSLWHVLQVVQHRCQQHRAGHRTHSQQLQQGALLLLAARLHSLRGRMGRAGARMEAQLSARGRQQVPWGAGSQQVLLLHARVLDADPRLPNYQQLTSLTATSTHLLHQRLHVCVPQLPALEHLCLDLLQGQVCGNDDI